VFGGVNHRLVRVHNVNISSAIHMSVGYEYYETPDDEYIYYINLHRQASFFVTRDKKIIHGSRYYSYNHESDNFISLNQRIVDEITEDDMENAVYIGDHIISICKWFITYGHFMDEAFVLCDFKDHFRESSSARVLLEYHTDNNIIRNYPVYKNYNSIDNLLFGNSSINAYNYGTRLLKMKKLYLIKHAITDESFHAFPMYSRNKILYSLLPPPRNIMRRILRPVVKLFITRNTAKHMTRNLDNEDEITQYLIYNKYAIINPEEMPFNRFVINLNKATHIIMTWGGALTNMCYCSPNTHIDILKSQSYESENLDLFEKIINTYQLNVRIVLHENNRIVIPFLD
jgi:hypothetical protein